LARRAADVFEKTKGTSDEAAASLLLARTLVMNGRLSDAYKLVDRVTAVATETHNRELELSAALMTARIGARSGGPEGTNEALRRLDRVIADAFTSGFEAIMLEARLAKGEIEMGSAEPTAGRAYLEALQKDAARDGFQLIAQKASAALRAGNNRSSNRVGN